MKFLEQPPRFLFFTGKGGVGKTSIACATAIQLGYWGLLALIALAFAWSHSGRHVFSPVSLEHLMVTAVTIGTVGPALLFALLDWKAEKAG